MISLGLSSSSSSSPSSSSSSTLSYGEVIPRITNIPSIRTQSPHRSLHESLPDPHSHSLATNHSRSHSHNHSRSISSASSRPPPHAALAQISPSQPPPPPLRTLDSVRDQVAQSIALQTIRKGEYVDGSKIGIVLTLASSSVSSAGSTHEDAIRFLRLIATKIKNALFTNTSSGYLFIIGTSGLAKSGESSPILIVSSSPELIHRASILISSKFIGRVSPFPLPLPSSFPSPSLSSYPNPNRTSSTTSIISASPSAPDRHLLFIQDLGLTAFDEEALWDVIRKSALDPVDPLTPPPSSLGIRQVLAIARAKLQRITPVDAYAELSEINTSPWPVILVDIRPFHQRRASGEIPGSLCVERNVLEWRFDPRQKEGGDGEEGGRLGVADRYDLRVIVFCEEGYTSSLAAASLHQLGMLNATDVIGGFRAWKEAGLPTKTGGSSDP